VNSSTGRKRYRVALGNDRRNFWCELYDEILFFVFSLTDFLRKISEPTCSFRKFWRTKNPSFTLRMFNPIYKSNCIWSNVQINVVFETHARKLTTSRRFQSDEHKYSRLFDAPHREIKNKSTEIRFTNKQAWTCQITNLLKIPKKNIFNKNTGRNIYEKGIKSIMLLRACCRIFFFFLKVHTDY